MAVVPMEQIRLCAMKRDRKAILELLQRRGIVEVHDAGGADEVFSQTDTSAQRAIFLKNADAAREAAEILDKAVPVKGGGPAFLRGRAPVSVKRYNAFRAESERVLHDARELIRLRREIAEAKAETLRCEAAAEALKPWMGLPVPQNFSGTRKTAVFVGALEGEWNLEKIFAALAEKAPGLDALHVEIISAEKSACRILAVVLKKDAAAAEDALRALGFARPPGASHLMPEEKRKRLAAARAEAERTIGAAEAGISGLAGRRGDLRYCEDYMKMRAEKYEVIEKLRQTRHVFVLTGYLPAENSAALAAELQAAYDCAAELNPAEAPGGEVPVLLKNSRFTEPVTSIVQAYSLPGKGELDPTGVMSVFYYLMFGLMFGDAGYGLLMAGICGYCLLRFKNMEPNWNRNIRLFFWCGVSTVFWGVVFSSYFGDVVDVVSATFFGGKVTIPPLWFLINDHPMWMLVFCLGLGIVHLTVGFVMKGVTNAKNGDYAGIVWDAVLPVMLWYPLMVLLAGSDMFYGIAGFRLALPASASPVCLGIAGAAVLGIILMGGRETKNWALRLVQGLYAVYNTLSGWLSDMLSYSRLLALGLASGVIASVMNQLGSMAGGGAAGLILFVCVFAAGHAMNFGINVLGAYVHSNRLEYIEFFGKFYDGGGREFAPFGIHTKYYKIVEEETSL